MKKESQETFNASLDVFKEVASLVVEKWRLASVRLIQKDIRITDQAITQKIQRNWGLITTHKGEKGKKKGRGRSTGDGFTEKLDKLFSILHCNCNFISCEAAKCPDDSCEKTHISCSCKQLNKVRE